MSLLAQIQHLTEQTYGATGVNFEEFIIGRERFLYLSQFDLACRELSDLARVFFRIKEDRLHVGIYYSKDLIESLESNDPRGGLSERNITAFCVFVEELNHAVHGALKFMEGSQDVGQESFAQDLELQAKIDLYLLLKYFLAYFNESKQLELMDRLWIRYHVFECEETDYETNQLAERYSEALRLGEKYTRFLDTLPPTERLTEIRQFRGLPYALKRRYIAMLP